MKAITVRNLAMSALVASFVGAAAFASAGDWHDRDFHERVIVRERPIAAIKVVIGAPVCTERIVCAPVVRREVIVRDRCDRRDHWR